MLINNNNNCLYNFNFRVSSINSADSQNLSFCKGLKLLESGCVENVLQVGKLKLTYVLKH